MGDDDAASDHQCDVERFFLLSASHAQAVGLDGVIHDAIVAAQAGRGDESHQLFRLGRERTFQIRIVIDVVETLHQEIAGLVDIGVEARAGFDEAARDLALVGDVLLGEKIRGLFAFRAVWSWVLRRRGMVAGGCAHGQIVAEAGAA